MSRRWPQWTGRTLEIISGEPSCFCGQPAERFVTVRWSLGEHSDHPVCGDHLRMYHADFDRLAVELRRVARESRQEENA